MDRVAHYECEGWGFESLMARQIKRVLHRRALFICVHINKGTRTRKGRCVRENVRWTFDQQRVQACTACAGRRMRSIRASPSWRPNRNTHRKMGVFVCVHINKRDSNPKGPLRPSMQSMRRTPYAQYTGKSLMARQIKGLEPNAPFVSANYFILYCVFKLS